MNGYEEKRELEKAIDAKVNEVLLKLESLEKLVNQQTDTIQRHAEQSKIHTADRSLRELFSWDRLYAQNT